jgi:hypothetical protein
MQMSISDLYSAIEPGVKTHFGLSYKKRKAVFSQIAFVDNIDEGIFDAQQWGGPNVLSRKVENAPIILGRIRAGWQKRFAAVTYTGGLQFSRESIEDAVARGQLREIRSASAAMGRATALTPDYLFAKFLDDGHTASETVIGDRLPLFSLVHTTPHGTTFQNTLTTPAPLGAEGVETMKILCGGMIGDDGLKAPLMLKKLVVPNELDPLAWKVVNTERAMGSNDNDKSYVEHMGLTVVVDHFLTNTTRWFGVTDVTTEEERGLFWYWRVEPEFERDNISMLQSMLMLARFRTIFGCIDARGIISSNATS